MKKIIILVIGMIAVLSLCSVQAWADTTTPSAIVGICAMEGKTHSPNANSMYFTEGGRYGINELTEMFEPSTANNFDGWGLSLGISNGDGTYTQGRVPVSTNTGWASDETWTSVRYLTYKFSDESVLKLSSNEGIGGRFIVGQQGAVTITVGLTAYGKTCIEKGPGRPSDAAAKKFREDFPEIAAIYDTPGQKISVTIEIYDDTALPFDISLTEFPTTLSAGDNVTIKALAVNNTDISQDALLIVVLYKNNEMVEIHYNDTNVSAQSSSELEVRFNLGEDTSGYRIKIFLWDKFYNPATNTGGKAFKDIRTIVIN